MIFRVQNLDRYDDKDAILREIISDSLAHRNYSSGYVAKPLLESKKLKYTIPEKPKGRLQKYITKQ